MGQIERFTPHLSTYLMKAHVFGLPSDGVSVYIPRCLRGQTGALANMVWPIIISTINFHQDTSWLLASTDLLRGAPAQPSTSRCLSNHIPPRKGLPACYPIVLPTQTSLLSNHFPPLWSTSWLAPNHRLESNSNMTVLFFNVSYSLCVCGREIRTGCV